MSDDTPIVEPVTEPVVEPVVEAPVEEQKSSDAPITSE
jgi:hypothetical protein